MTPWTFCLFQSSSVWSKKTDLWQFSVTNFTWHMHTIDSFILYLSLGCTIPKVSACMFMGAIMCLGSDRLFSPHELYVYIHCSFTGKSWIPRWIDFLLIFCLIDAVIQSMCGSTWTHLQQGIVGAIRWCWLFQWWWHSPWRTTWASTGPSCKVPSSNFSTWNPVPTSPFPMNKCTGNDAVLLFQVL